MSKLTDKFLALKINNAGVTRYVAADAILCINPASDGKTLDTVIYCKADMIVTLTHAADGSETVLNYLNNMWFEILNDDKFGTPALYTDSPLAITKIVVA